ncbi:MAG: hypothetical protein ISR96_08665 [Nitrospira sp.]|nr:hypothetical protein [Nitrospira sp.]
MTSLFFYIPGFAIHDIATIGNVPEDCPLEDVQACLAPMKELSLFPCTDCHDKDWETDPTKRELAEPHDEYPGKFLNHDSENRWCLDCHSEKERDKFRLINGQHVEFNEYYKVCAQCHGKMYRQWKLGIHAKITGHWDGGEKQQWHCTMCHDPHNPPFKPQKPAAPPVRPENLRGDY